MATHKKPSASTAAAVNIAASQPPGESPAGDNSPGELSAADMTKAAGLLLQQAAQVTLRIADAANDSEAKALLAAHRDLTARAMKLNNKAITLLAGEAKVEGSDIVAAIDQANQTLQAIAEIQKALALVQKVLGLAGAVLTGNGTAIVSAIANLAAG